MHFNKLIPELTVSNLAASRVFYCDALGFKVDYERPEDKFLFVSLEGAQLMLEEVNGHWETGPLARPYGRGINLQIEVNDVQALYDSLKAAGHMLFREIQTQTYKTSMGVKSQSQFLIQDPDGYLLRFCC
jgi:catechol 2,3-dioxygenase-like lactoylglutathione lyase family enzyme